MAEHGSVQKEKVTEDYNDAYPLKFRKDDYEINIWISDFICTASKRCDKNEEIQLSSS